MTTRSRTTVLIGMAAAALAGAVACRAMASSSAHNEDEKKAVPDKKGSTMTEKVVHTDEEWQRIFAVNVNGAFYTTRAALPALRRSRGVVINVSSMTALVGQSHGAAYVASKGALVSLTRALALELAPDGIRVNCVCPAGVDTPLMRSWAATLPDPAAVLKGQAEMHLLNRLATAGDIAAAIVFLASPAAAFITGTILPVDGGATLGYRRT